MEKLTIQHIAPYLPYGLQVQISKQPLRGEIHKLAGILYDGLVRLGEGGMYGFPQRDFESIKPILYPISCLTKNIQHEGREFCPLIELAKIAFGYDDWEIEDDYAIYGSLDFMYEDGSFTADRWEAVDVPNQYQLFQKLAEWHINFVGIPEGLYIDKNTLK